jgi:hypothetical protein
MSYFVFTKDLENIESSLYKIAENQYDLNNLNINISDYKIIEDSQINFENVKYGVTQVINYQGNLINYKNINIEFNTKENLKYYINNCSKIIKQFLDNDKDSPLFNKWNDYLTQLNNLNLDSITYPLEKSLEQYFNDLGQPSYNILQLP